MCMLFVYTTYTILNVVVIMIECSVHVSDGFPKNNLVCELYPFCLDFFKLCKASYKLHGKNN